MALHHAVDSLSEMVSRHIEAFAKVACVPQGADPAEVCNLAPVHIASEECCKNSVVL